MYNLNITNSYRFDVTVGDKTIAKDGGTGEVGPIGNAIFEIPGIGQFVALDLGDKKIEGYELNETWGVLFRFKTYEVYARYEGGGSYDIDIDQYGSIAITANTGSAIIIQLNELELKTK